jgi:predicted ATPase/class 3 adenylate cyclase
LERSRNYLPRVARNDLPAGTVTFLFTDVEGSTKLLHELGSEAYAVALAEHRRVVREAFARHGGIEVDTQGDAFFIAFPTAAGALGAARDAQAALAKGPIRVRIGVHTGTPHVSAEGYVGPDVHKGARIAATGHGGQVLLSKETQELVDVDLMDLGEHRLKDFSEPVWIFQLGKERFPPITTISNTNLPRPASSFVGRDRELQEVVSRLRDGGRLLTLTGPGGSGKTRLAIEAAAEVVPKFRNGVFWVGLAPLRDPVLVLSMVAQTVGAKDGLAEHFGQREMLLLLDNFEQVIEAAPELATLVEACPNLKLLVTSRELLRVRAEVEYAVPALAQPEAVELFRARSQLEPDESIAELCRRLDNLPLALELAAARTSVLTPAQILERIAKRLDLFKGGRDTEVRQQTLRATIEWSYDLLSKKEKALFARLAVFAGGCTLESAEGIAQADLDVLQSLVDKSLLRHTDDRFSMLETIRGYALERLEHSGEANEMRRSHAEHFLALAEETELHLFEADPEAWHERLERELDNLRAALDVLESTGEDELALRMAGALAEFWAVKGHQREGRPRLERALAHHERPTLGRAKALNRAANLAIGAGDAATATLRAEEALALNRALGLGWGTAESLLLLGGIVTSEGDFGQGQQLLDESVRLFDELGDEHNALEATRLLAGAYRGFGDLDHATALLEENLRRARALGDNKVEATTLEAVARYALDDGRVPDALPMLKRAYRINRDVGEDYRARIIVCYFARVLALLGKMPAAARVLSSSEVLIEEIGVRPPWIVKMNEGTLSTVRAQLDDSTFSEAWNQGMKLTADEAVALAVESLE